MGFINTGEFAPFINGAYGVSVAFLLAIGVMSFTRYRRATRRLAQAEAAK